MSIVDLDVDFRGIFSCGQAYVALSRAVTFDNLVLRSYQAKHIRAHPLVKKYYSDLQVKPGPGSSSTPSEICLQAIYKPVNFLSVSFADITENINSKCLYLWLPGLSDPTSINNNKSVVI